ncbi:MAG: hypothetical protein Q8Q28_01580 [Pseudomonadota bacterium]|nr:hypothetical protein [Pseudomonadota bacterium]
MDAHPTGNPLAAIGMAGYPAMPNSPSLTDSPTIDSFTISGLLRPAPALSRLTTCQIAQETFRAYPVVTDTH